MFEYSTLEVNADTNTIKSKVPDDITLYDNVVVLNYKTDWVVIKLDILLLNPIIHIKNGDEYLSILLCLKTLRAMAIPAQVYFDSYDEENLYQIQFKLESGEQILFDDRNINLKRFQCKIQSLRSALIEYGDVKYLHHPTKELNLKLKNYYLDNYDANGKDITNLQFHPKTLTTLIQYIDKEKVKTTILVGLTSNIMNSTGGYEPKKDKIDNYLAQQIDKLVEKDAFIMQCLLYTARILYPNSKAIVME
jgi:hypothetical protein